MRASLKLWQGICVWIRTQLALNDSTPMPRFRPNPFRRVLLRTGVCAVLLIAGLCAVYAWFGWAFEHRVYSTVAAVPEADVALVLGTSPKLANGQPNAFFVNRMHAAASLYHACKVRKLILSGDNGSAYYNEPEAMRRALIALGVRDADIVLDYAGFRTFDSVVRCREVFGQRRVVVVSQAFHAQRALAIADAKGLQAVGFSAEMPHHSASTTRVLVREAFARCRTLLDCYVLNTAPRYLGQPVNVFASR
jgi:SanA protein